MSRRRTFFQVFLSFPIIGTMSEYGALAQVQKLSAYDIMKKHEEVRKISTLVASAKMTTKSSDGKERVKDFTWWRKLQPDGIHFNTLTRFHFPPEIKGEGVLFLENTNGKADVQLYLPKYKKVRRVESSQQSSSFMGSDFSYSDIATPHFEDFEYKTIKSEKCPGEESSSWDCHLIESKPKTDEVRERTGYLKAETWVRADNFMAVRVFYYDLQNQFWKNLDAAEIKLVDSKNSKWMAHFLKMENILKNKVTTIKFDKVKVGEVIPETTFTIQNLSRE